MAFSRALQGPMADGWAWSAFCQLSGRAILAKFAHVPLARPLSQRNECQRILLFATFVSLASAGGWMWNGCLNYDARP